MQFTALKPGKQVHYYTTVLEHITIAGAKVDVPSVRKTGWASTVSTFLTKGC